MDLKKCRICSKEKNLGLFPRDPTKKQGVGSACNECREIYPTILKKKCKECNKVFTVTGKRKLTKYCSSECVKTNKKKYKKNYDSQNREKINTYVKSRRVITKNDPLIRFKNSISQSIRDSFRMKSWRKNSRTRDILGCTFLEFKNYIEYHQEDWMNINNYGIYNGERNYGWDLDHVIPLSVAETRDGLIKLCHFTNLKPLCSYENRVIKRDKIENYR